MQSTTRITAGIVATVALALAAYTAAGAQGPARGQGQGQGQGHGAGPGGWGPRGGPGMGGMLMLRGLELTGQQREQIRGIREAHGGPGAAIAAGQLHRQLRAEILADLPDQQRLSELRQQVLEAHQARIDRQLAVGAEIAQVLTAEQRATLRERLAQAPGRGGPGGRRGMRGAPFGGQTPVTP
jgi:Spy/CpxP family protein refolding chaperone